MRRIVACEGCDKKTAEVQSCQIRVMNFQVWNNQCPREKEISTEVEGKNMTFKPPPAKKARSKKNLSA